MGLTGHLAFAFDPADEAAVIGVLTGQGGDDSLIRIQPRFDLIREDHYEVHRVLEVLANKDAKFSPLANTIIYGKRPLLELGMGSQSIFSRDEVAEIAAALSLVESSDIDDALDDLEGEYPELTNDPVRNNIHRLIKLMRDEMSKIAQNHWALIAGMF